MQPMPFSLERALRVTAPFEPRTNSAGLGYREGQLLTFEQSHADTDAEPQMSLRWDANHSAPSRLRGIDSLQLRRTSYSVVDGGTGLQLTHVLRHSPEGLRWRNSHGESSRLQAGSTFVSQSREDSLVEFSPLTRGANCDCLRMMLQADFSLDLSLHLKPEDVPFCNSADACVRVLLGHYRDHVANVTPAPRVSVLDVDLVPLAELDIPVTADHWALAVLTSGSVQHRGRLVEAMGAIAFPGREPLARIATQTGASFIWLEVPYAAPEPGPRPALGSRLHA